MSRIGKLPITIPDGVKIDIQKDLIVVTGPKGTEKSPLYKGIVAEINNNQLVLNLDDEYFASLPDKKSNKKIKALYGLVRALANNSVIGTTQGFTKELEIRGVGYRAAAKENGIQFQLGFSHEVFYAIPSTVKAEVKTATEIIITGTNKETVGQIAAEIRSLKKPEPYKGKGIRYKNEYIIMKAGKTGKK